MKDTSIFILFLKKIILVIYLFLQQLADTKTKVIQKLHSFSNFSKLFETQSKNSMSERNSNSHSHLSSANQSLKEQPKSKNQSSSETSSHYSNLQTYITPSQASNQNYQQQDFNFGQNKNIKKGNLSVTSYDGRKRVYRSDIDKQSQYQNEVIKSNTLNRPRTLSKSINMNHSFKLIPNEKKRYLSQAQERNASSSSLHRYNNYSASSIYNSPLNHKIQGMYNKFEKISEARIQLQSGQDQVNQYEGPNEQKKQIHSTQAQTRRVYQTIINEQKAQGCCCNVFRNSIAKKQE